MSKRPFAIAALAMTLFAVLPTGAVAQQWAPGAPMFVGGSALAMQPPSGSPACSGCARPPSTNPEASAPGPETVGPKLAGKDLAKAVATVGKLHWYDRLGDARARATATGKPILFLQALGDLEGFA